MADTATPLVFDGHNDLISKIMNDGGRRKVPSLEAGRAGALDLQKMRAGGFGGGLFSIFVSGDGGYLRNPNLVADPPYDLPLKVEIPWEQAVLKTFPLLSLMIEVQRHGHIQICRSVRELRQCFDSDKIAAVMHLESPECIDPEFYTLDLAHELGLRSLGLAWGRPNIFASGVPFRFPSGPDIGDGLTENGVNLVRRCDALGIMVDVSHLNEAGFWDVARFYTKPLVACHSNANEVCASSRNLTDAQLDAIRESEGLVGLSFAAAFVRPDGRRDPDTNLADFMSHLEYVIERVGEDGVALGSDFDGATLIKPLDSADKLTNLRAEMMRRNYGERLIRKICHENWFRVLEKTWGH